MRRSPRHPSIRLVLVLVTCLLLVGSYASAFQKIVEADTGDKDAHLGFLRRDKTNEAWRGPKWITRNLVIGNPISVCSPEFPMATAEAVARWNDALGIEAFQMVQSPQVCNPEKLVDGWMPEDGVVSLTVSRGRQEGEKFYALFIPRRTGCSVTGSRACAGFDRMAYSSEQERAADQWKTYSGRAEIIINPRIYCQDINESSDDCERDSAAQTKLGGKRNLVHDITHELGHILGLADYYCHYDSHPDGLEASTDPDERSLMNSLNQPPYDECDPDDGAPTTRDLRDYTAAYTPAAVTELQAKAVRNTFRV